MTKKAKKTDNSPQTEVTLVCAAREGDQDALLKLLQANWHWLKGLVYNLLNNADDVDETLQELCVLVIRKIQDLREPERFRAWLATIARHAALAYREKRSRKAIQLDELLAAQQQQNNNIDPHEKIAQDEQYQQLLDALKKLPEKYREIFILKHLREMTYNEISQILDIPVTTVQIRLVRARRMIYNHMTGRPNQKVPRT